jgi:uncharacterized membrane protein (DUF4010 family)
MNRTLARPGEMALLVTVMLGALAQQSPGLAAALAVVVALLLQARQSLHRLGRDLISEAEMRDGLLLLAAALLMLPLMPDRAMGPFEALNPQKLWRLVVLVMAVSALGHIALRLIGSRFGLPVAGFFAGFVSSTAAIAGFGQRARGTPSMLQPSAHAGLFAALASTLLLLPVLPTVSAALLQTVLPQLLAFAALLAAGGAIGLRGGSGAEPAPTQDSWMFRFRNTLYFAALMAGVLLVLAFLNQQFGGSGVLVAAFIAALAEVHAPIASVGQLFNQGSLELADARHTVLAVLGASVLSRSAVAWTAGGSAFSLRMSAGRCWLGWPRWPPCCCPAGHELPLRPRRVGFCLLRPLSCRRRRYLFTPPTQPKSIPPQVAAKLFTWLVAPPPSPRSSRQRCYLTQCPRAMS